MGIFDFWSRGKRAARARLNASSLDDEGLGGSLEGTLRQLRAEVEALGAAAADAAALSTRLTREQERLLAQADDWRGKARQALQGGREDLARTALGRSKELQDKAAGLAAQLSEAEARAEELRGRVERGRERISEAERTMAALAARRSAAAAQKKVARALNELDDDDAAFATLSRLERKVEEEEAVAAAYEEIVRADRQAGAAGAGERGGTAGAGEGGGVADPLEDELRALEDELRKGR